MKRFLSVFAGASLLALSGVASADEPTILSATTLDAVTAGGTVEFDTNVFKTVEINKVVNLTVFKDVDADVDIEGRLATAEASADALGENALAETDTFAQVDDSGAFAFSESLAAVDNGGGG
ncbi:hypothetical protein HBA54_27600 [Pelagibius litoralis]|uniref:Uncharacterized protein n=1 Tax=Pelagibius litoralis TaxID=374515 RepID=A0A967KFC2_9PROT|nr:hypothetical protein [Pelagibius litoralis]NIA72359.1 hypothetical protein [Pelagibius litoralis]